MQPIFYRTLIALGALALVAPAFSDAEADKSEIKRLRAESNAAIEQHDAAAIVAMFADTYQITTGAGNLYHDTPDKERQLWESLFAENPDVVYVRTPDRIEISAYLPRAAESGNWVGTWTSDDGAIELGGTYSASWIQVDGRWKIQSEMFVTLYCGGPAC